MAAREVIALEVSSAGPGARMPPSTADDRRYLLALTRCTPKCNARPDALTESTHILWLCRGKEQLPRGASCGHHRRRLGRSAPVLGRSSLRPDQHAGKCSNPIDCGRCCARGRAYPENTAICCPQKCSDST